MRKTTVYLDDSQAERLGRIAASSGRSQAELIREGIDRVLEEAPSRTFHSLGKGRGGGHADRSWDTGDLYRGVRGRPGDDADR